MRVLAILSISVVLVVLVASPAGAMEIDLFSGAEMRGSSVGLSTGFKLATPAVPERPGVVVMGLVNAGAGLARAPPAQGGFWYAPHGEVAGSLLVGAQWAVPGGTLMAAAGPGLVRRQEAEPIGAPRWLRQRIGPVALVEAWLHPRPHLLATGTLIASAPAGSLWARGAVGIAAWEGAFVGPEATISTDRSYRELRLGAHLTGVRIGALSLRLSAGAAFHERRSTPYVALVIDRRL